jgi:radical SAM superfamily enzyme YgiQ (UPF0313 family)
MNRSIHLINPASDYPSYYGADVIGAYTGSPAALVADLTIATVAGMVPHDMQVTMVDENISPVNFDIDADFIGITGRVSQYKRMITIADEFRLRGKTVVIGGPFATLCPEIVRSHCDILVRGEIEGISRALFKDLKTGVWEKEYIGGRPDLSDTAMPRWDLYQNDRALIGSVQTSRGCPFECEFCDTIQYVGRKQRHKPVPAIIKELDQLYKHGYRVIFIADDNFTAYRSRAREVLSALSAWNRQQKMGSVSFATQVSIDAAKDTELLEMCADAGLTYVFIGIETPNEDSLKDSKKRQNLSIDLTSQVACFVEKGIAVMAGMIVGFDTDGPDIFDRQYEFAASLPVPMFSLGALVAPATTPLYDRLQSEGRLLKGDAAIASMTPWDTNIIPKLMTRREMLDGIRDLSERLYTPAAFAERVVQFIRNVRVNSGNDFSKDYGTIKQFIGRSVEMDSVRILSKLRRNSKDQKEMWSIIRSELQKKPGVSLIVMTMLLQYMQARYMIDSISHT